MKMKLLAARARRLGLSLVVLSAWPGRQSVARWTEPGSMALAKDKQCAQPERGCRHAVREGRKALSTALSDSSDSDDAVPVPAPVPVPVVGRCTYKAEVMNQTCCAGFFRNGYASLKLKVIIFTEMPQRPRAPSPLGLAHQTRLLCCTSGHQHGRISLGPSPMSDTFYEIVVPDGVAPGQAFQASVGGMLMVQQQLEPR